MLITEEQETLLLLVLNNDFVLAHPVMEPLRGLLRELRQRCMTRSLMGEIVREVSR
jgi:hypothetical protein